MHSDTSVWLITRTCLIGWMVYTQCLQFGGWYDSYAGGEQIIAFTTCHIYTVFVVKMLPDLKLKELGLINDTGIINSFSTNLMLLFCLILHEKVKCYGEYEIHLWVKQNSVMTTLLIHFRFGTTYTYYIESNYLPERRVTVTFYVFVKTSIRTTKFVFSSFSTSKIHFNRTRCSQQKCKPSFH